MQTMLHRLVRMIVPALPYTARVPCVCMSINVCAGN